MIGAFAASFVVLGFAAFSSFFSGSFALGFAFEVAVFHRLFLFGAFFLAPSPLEALLFAGAFFLASFTSFFAFAASMASVGWLFFFNAFLDHTWR